MLYLRNRKRKERHKFDGSCKCKKEAACESALSTPHFTVMNGAVFRIRCKEIETEGTEEMQDYW